MSLSASQSLTRWWKSTPVRVTACILITMLAALIAANIGGF